VVREPLEELRASPSVYNMIHYVMIEGSLEVKLPTIWTVEKQR
jgi:hypothetical protein